ncbi:MAG TPA: PepSY-associated TM helix domain-containing protein, partial [Opitutus sp.]|nr:PepSY-associated TM helix domain-containing protein [Opitutus sp.]
MSFRKVVFWLHLVAGLISGISIGIMCLTGTALAFEKQLVAWSERDARQLASPIAGQPRLPLDDLARRVRDANPDTPIASIAISSDPRATVAFSLGRDHTVFANPYTGELLRPASTTVRDFLQVMVAWHRFLALSGDQRPIGKVINGVCNLAFFALAVTGLYLWMPRNWSWRSVRAIALFNGKLTGKARDFNWHNVIGLWSAPILILLTLTAVPISFRWGTSVIY